MVYECIRVSTGNYDFDTKEFTETNFRMMCFASNVPKKRCMFTTNVDMLGQDLFDGGK